MRCRGMLGFENIKFFAFFKVRSCRRVFIGLVREKADGISLFAISETRPAAAIRARIEENTSED